MLAAFLAATRRYRSQFNKFLAVHGLHHGQAFCLWVLAAHEGISQRDLALTLHLTPPTVSKMLQALERSGAVKRTPDANDQRLLRVRLTTHGRALERKIRNAGGRFVNATIGRLPESERHDLARLLDDLAESFTCVDGAGQIR